MIAEREFAELGALVHPSVVLVSKIRPGVVVEGRDDFVAFVQGTLAESLHDSVTMSFRPLDDERIIVEGRIRWIDDDRVIRDDPVTWAMEFRDGLLLRFVPARTAVEAETILGAGAS